MFLKARVADYTRHRVEAHANGSVHESGLRSERRSYL